MALFLKVFGDIHVGEIVIWSTDNQTTSKHANLHMPTAELELLILNILSKTLSYDYVIGPKFLYIS